jgi:hypothetical protein
MIFLRDLLSDFLSLIHPSLHPTSSPFFRKPQQHATIVSIRPAHRRSGAQIPNSIPQPTPVFPYSSRLLPTNQPNSDMATLETPPIFASSRDCDKQTTMATSPERRNSTAKPVIDREKTTPFLLRLFVRTGGFHRYVPLGGVLRRDVDFRIDDFESPERIPVEDEVQIYTW